MTREQNERLYDIVREAYKRHGSALVEGPYADDTCTISSSDDKIVVCINSEIPFVATWFNLVAEVKEAFVNEGYVIENSEFFHDFLILTLKIAANA